MGPQALCLQMAHLRHGGASRNACACSMKADSMALDVLCSTTCCDSCTVDSASPNAKHIEQMASRRWHKGNLMMPR